jgi:hypothetical protein
MKMIRTIASKTNNFNSQQQTTLKPLLSLYLWNDWNSEQYNYLKQQQERIERGQHDDIPADSSSLLSNVQKVKLMELRKLSLQHCSN